MISLFQEKFLKNKAKTFPWPLCIGGKHERQTRTFLPLAILWTPPPTSFCVEGGGRTIAMPAMTGWPRIERSLLEYKMYNCLSLFNLSADPKKWDQRNWKLRKMFYFIWIHMNILWLQHFSVSSFMTFRSAGKKALQGHNIVEAILDRGVKRAILMRLRKSLVKNVS